MMSQSLLTRLTATFEMRNGGMLKLYGRWPQRQTAWTIFWCLLMFVQQIAVTDAGPLKAWTPKRGCHKVGHKRTISLSGCESVEVVLNACRGHCLSWSIPSSETVLRTNARHRTTAFSFCCRMSDHEDVKVIIDCNDGPREVTVPSATKCECLDCGAHNSI